MTKQEFNHIKKQLWLETQQLKSQIPQVTPPHFNSTLVKSLAPEDAACVRYFWHLLAGRNPYQPELLTQVWADHFSSETELAQELYWQLSDLNRNQEFLLNDVV